MGGLGHTAVSAIPIRKAAPSVIVALFQYLFSGRNTFNQMVVSIALVIASYLVLLSGEYLWKLFLCAPLALDRENGELLSNTKAEVERIRKRLEEPKISALDQSRRDLVADKLTDAESKDIELITYVLRHGQVDATALIRSASRNEQRLYQEAINKAIGWGLLKVGPHLASRPGPLIPNPDLIDALSFHLLQDHASSSESSQT